MQTEVIVPVEAKPDKRKVLVGNEPMLFHCHHYNAYLQQTILDANYIDSRPFLVGAAAEVAYSQLANIFRKAPKYVDDISARKRFAEYLYSWAGFGKLSLASVEKTGGEVHAPSSHYVMGWKARNRKPSDSQVCHFTAGWLAGALAAIFDRPNGSYSVEESACAATAKADHCVFVLKEGSPNYNVYESVGPGHLTDHQPQAVPENNVDYEGVFQAVSGMSLVGNDRGIIPAFGVYLTRHYANYYNRISFEFEREIIAQFGNEGLEIASSLLVEAGRVCAFNTFGGIMKSTEWDALIKPNLQNREDWAHGITAVINALGWGRYQVTSVSREGSEFVIHDDYESSGYLSMYGKADHHISYLGQGAVVGIMNLIYFSDISSKPDLDEDFYRKTFKSPHVYEARHISSKAAGDEVTTFQSYVS